MLETNRLDELVDRLSGFLPREAGAAEADLRKAFRAALEAGIARLDLVTREEFDAQRQVLLRTREKLDALEQSLADIEVRLATR